MPLHAIAAAPWFRLFGSTLISTRILSAAAGLAALLCWFFIIGKITGDQTHCTHRALPDRHRLERFDSGIHRTLRHAQRGIRRGRAGGLSCTA